MQFLGKFGKIVCWRPPGELTPPPRGNPRSATDYAAIEMTSVQCLVFLSATGFMVVWYDYAVGCVQVPNNDTRKETQISAIRNF